MHTLRGVDADDLVIIDEMAYIDPELFYEVILPLIGVTRTRILGISTPSRDTFNFFHRMTQLCYPGTSDHVFKTHSVELVCKYCKRLKQFNSCRHELHKLPEWKSASKLEVIKLIYGPERQEMEARENLGMMLADKDCVFEQEWLEALGKRVRWENQSLQYAPSIIFTACDPNAGGESQMALVSVAYIMGMLVIVGLDGHAAATPNEVNAMLHGHINALRQNPFLADATIMFIGEKNTGMESARMWDVVADHPRTTALYQHRQPTTEKERMRPHVNPGIDTTYEIKNKYAYTLNQYLDAKRLMFLADGASGSPYSPQLGNEFERQRMAILEQLSRCRRYKPPSTFDNPGVRVCWSGKVDHTGRKIAGLKDDMAMALAIVVYWADRIMELDYPTVDYAMLGLK